MADLQVALGRIRMSWRSLSSESESDLHCTTGFLHSRCTFLFGEAPTPHRPTGLVCRCGSASSRAGRQARLPGPRWLSHGTVHRIETRLQLVGLVYGQCCLPRDSDLEIATPLHHRVLQVSPPEASRSRAVPLLGRAGALPADLPSLREHDLRLVWRD